MRVCLRSSLLVLVLMGGVACSDDGSSGSPSTGSAPTTTQPAAGPAETTAATAPVTAPPTTEAPVPVLPAGVQYDTAHPVALPAGTSTPLLVDGTWYVLSQVDSAIPTCPRNTGPCTRFAGNPVLLTVAADGSTQSVQIDDVTTYRLPSGYSMPNGGLTPRAVARGAGGFVVAGTANIWDSDLFHRVTIRSLLWFSSDGAAWQRVDLRDVVGDVNLLVTTVVATDGGFLAAGEIGSADIETPSRGIVLGSADGISWHTVAELPGTYSIDISTLRADGDVVLASGVEYVCTTNSGAMNDFSVGGQTRVWASIDGGATFAAVDLAAAGVSSAFPAPPADPATCPPDLGARDAFKASLRLVDVAAGRIVLGAPDAVTVASTTDLSTWTPATLEDGAPDGSASVPVSTRLAVAGGGGIVITSLEPRRGPNGATFGDSSQVLAWRSDDGAATWQPLERPRPLRSDEVGTPRHVGDGLVAMVGIPAADGSSHVLIAPAGELVAWGSCEPGPGADCSFADLTGQSFTDADLTGIVLTGATLSGAVLDGADLTGADLTGTGTIDASLRGATLDGAHLAGVSFSGADLAGASLAGADLTGAKFLNFGQVVPLNGVSFAGANVTDVLFAGVDLTGVDFSGADLGRADDFTQVSFSDTVVCPDGAPADTTQRGPAACRLG